MKKRMVCLLVAGFLMMGAPGEPIRAQEFPTEYTNLKIFPADIEPDRLKAAMRGFKDQLGVECTFCHVKGEWASDENKHKVQARRMIRLVQYLNENAELYFEEDVDRNLLSCGTCHRGVAEVEPYEPEDDEAWN